MLTSQPLLLLLQLNAEYQSDSITFKQGEKTWFRPVTLDDLLDLKKRFPNCEMVAGHTDVGKFRIQNMFQKDVIHTQVKFAP